MGEGRSRSESNGSSLSSLPPPPPPTLPVKIQHPTATKSSRPYQRPDPTGRVPLRGKLVHATVYQRNSTNVTGTQPEKYTQTGQDSLAATGIRRENPSSKARMQKARNRRVVLNSIDATNATNSEKNMQSWKKCALAFLLLRVGGKESSRRSSNINSSQKKQETRETQHIHNCLSKANSLPQCRKKQFTKKTSSKDREVHGIWRDKNSNRYKSNASSKKTSELRTLEDKKQRNRSPGSSSTCSFYNIEEKRSIDERGQAVHIIRVGRVPR